MTDPIPDRGTPGNPISVHETGPAVDPHYPSAASRAFAAEQRAAKATKPEKFKNGEAIRKAVGELHAKLTELASEHEFEVGPMHTFNLEFDVFDPVTGMIMSPARAHRRDIGDAGQLMSAEAVVSDIVAARRHQETAGVTQYSVDRVA